MTGRAMVPDTRVHALTDKHLHEMALKIMRSVSGISAVFVDVTNKPPGTTEWE